MTPLKYKIIAAVGGALSIGGPGLAALGPLGLVAGLGVSALGAALATYGAYKIEPPREVWTEEQRRAHRAAQPPEPYDDDAPAASLPEARAGEGKGPGGATMKTPEEMVRGIGIPMGYDDAKALYAAIAARDAEHAASHERQDAVKRDREDTPATPQPIPRKPGAV